jgi:hypothetical protein
VVQGPGSPLRSGRDDGENWLTVSDGSEVLPGALQREAVRRKPGIQEHDAARTVVLCPGSPLRSGRDDGENWLTVSDGSEVIPGALQREAVRRRPGMQEHDAARMVVLGPGSPLRSGRDDGGNWLTVSDGSEVIPGALQRDAVRRRPGIHEPDAARTAVLGPGSPLRSGRDDGAISMKGCSP